MKEETTNDRKEFHDIEYLERVRRLEELVEHLQQENESNQQMIRTLNQKLQDNIYYVQRYRRFHPLTRASEYLLDRIRYKRQEKLVNKYHLFDSKYYLENNPDLVNYAGNLEYHYLRFGWREYRNPCSEFNTQYYIESNKDVKNQGVMPLLHYIKHGFQEGRNPSENTDKLKEWARFQVNNHSLKRKLLEMRSMYYIYRSKMFSGEYYLNKYPEVAKSLQQSYAWKLRGSRIPMVRLLGKLCTTPIKHYVKYGMYEGMNPNSSFDTRFYFENYNDLRVASYINLFEHYCRYGRIEGRNCKELSVNQYTCLKELRGNLKQESNVSVFLPYADDIKELLSRINCVVNQKVTPFECIITDSNEEIEETVKKMQKDCLIPFRFIHPKEDSNTLFERIKTYAKGEYIWVLEENHLASNDFIERLLIKIRYDRIVLAECYTDQIDENVSWLFDHEGNYYSTGISEIENDTIGFAPNYSLSRMLIKNPNQYPNLINQSWNLTDPYGLARFVMNYLTKGLFVHTKERLLYCKNSDSRMGEGSFDVDERYLYIKDLYHLYHFDPKVIQKQYEALRTNCFSDMKNSIFYCLNHSKIEDIFLEEYQPNILISIYSFTHGGGEIMPIRLANELYAKGVNVYVHVFNTIVVEEKVRNMLNSNIPVFYSGDIDLVATFIHCYGIDVVNTHHQALQSFFGNNKSLFEEKNISFYHVGTSHGLYDEFKDSTLAHIFYMLKNGVDHWTYVADKNIIPFQKMNVYHTEDFTKIPNGMLQPKLGNLSRKELNIPEDAFVCAIASRAIKEKGWYDAIECVKQVRKQTDREVHLILIGEGPVYEELREQLLPEYIHLLGFRDNACDYYNIADVELLLSTYKSESAPLTLIEAMMVGKPVIASNIGDIKQMLTINDEMAGSVVDLVQEKVPHDSVVRILLRMITDSKYYHKCCEVARRKSKEYEISHIADLYMAIYQKSIQCSTYILAQECKKEVQSSNRFLLEACSVNAKRKVSVIVPNYNHSKFLRQRLDSIYHQTYKNIEVILLDDCSKDNSREILEEYAKKYPKITRLVFNEKNSGGVFHQWSKGISLATGDICWIAESDDYCESNLIEKLLPAFEDPSVKISYCQYQFVNQNGEAKEFTFDDYVSDISTMKWKENYVNATDLEVKEALAKINSIPNASGALFRKPEGLDLYNNKRWLSMKICGDWIFYLYVIQGGKVSFSIDTTSYFRFHDNNSSASTYSRQDYYTEHAYVAETLRELYGVEQPTLQIMYDKIKDFFKLHVKDKQIDFNQLFNLDKIMMITKKENEVKEITSEKNNSDTVKKSKKYESIIINPIKSAETNLDADFADRMYRLGNNTGNMLFVEGMKGQLIYKDDLYPAPQEGDALDQVAMVMPSSNFIIRGRAPFIENVHAFMDSCKGPFTLAGLGAQSASKDDTPKKLVSELHPEKIKFFHALSERAVSIGVRGEFTAQCLEEMGIYNYRIIGCPSAYMNLDSDFKMNRQPSAERCVFNVTTKNAMESKIVDLGIRHNDQWIMQMMAEMPEIMLADKVMSEEEYVCAFPGISASKEQLTSFMKSNAHMFLTYQEWCDYIIQNHITFSYGSRFHGNMCSLRNGVPALWITHDSRTNELVRTLHLPSISYEQLETVKSVEELVEFCDYDDFNKNYKKMVQNYVQFLEENGLSHKFKN